VLLALKAGAADRNVRDPVARLGPRQVRQVRPARLAELALGRKERSRQVIARGLHARPDEPIGRPPQRRRRHRPAFIRGFAAHSLVVCGSVDRRHRRRDRQRRVPARAVTSRKRHQLRHQRERSAGCDHHPGQERHGGAARLAPHPG
jgi:hypothetical protein